MKNYKRLTPFKRCVLQNFPFIEADFDALTNYGLLCKIVEYLNNVIASQNEVQENVEALNNAFIELKSYVDNFFDNLDVQDEINNKLDELVEDGTLANIIANFIQNKLKIFAPDYDHDGDLVVYEFNKNNDKKLLIVDFGLYAADSYTKLKTKLVAKGYTKFDYAIISHYHYDHVGMLQYMLADSTFDFSECEFYLPVTPDYSQFVGSTRYVPEMESNIKELLNNNGITYHIASNSTVLTVLDDFTIKFFNSDLTDFTGYYNVTTTHSDTGTTPVTNYNNFSMVNLIEFNGKRVLTTGDIEVAAEAHLTPIIKVVPDVLKVEHHARTYSVDRDYLGSICKAKVNLIMREVAEVQPYVLNQNAEMYHTGYSGDVEITLNQYDVTVTSENGAMPSDAGKFKLDNTCNEIPDNADLNDYVYPCDMVVRNATSAATISNAPTTSHGYRLITVAKNYTYRVIQYVIQNDNDIVYSRYCNYTTWSEWRVIQDGGTNVTIAANTDLNDLPTGCYYMGANTAGVLHIPTEVATNRNKITVSNFGNDGSKTQLLESRKIISDVSYPLMYWRVLHQGKTWGDWFRISNFPENIAANSDLDNFQVEGKYCSPDQTTTASLSNVPTGVTKSFHLEVIKTSQTPDRTIQKLIPSDTPFGEYIRIKTSSGWSSWYKYDLTEVTSQ